VESLTDVKKVALVPLDKNVKIQVKSNVLIEMSAGSGCYC